MVRWGLVRLCLAGRLWQGVMMYGKAGKVGFGEVRPVAVRQVGSCMVRYGSVR